MISRLSRFSAAAVNAAWHRKSLAALLALAGLNAGCVPLLIGGAAAAAGGTIMTDRRSPGMQLIDKNIEFRVSSEVNSSFPSATTRVNAKAFNQRVLLTGEIASEQDKAKATEIARQSQDVRDVLNELQVGPVADFQTRAKDSLIGSDVRTQLIAAKDVPSRTIALAISQGAVYMMGQVTAAEAEKAAQVASQVSGVTKVVKAFDIKQEGGTAPQPAAPAAQPAAPAAQAAPAAGGSTQTFPLQ